MRHVIQNQEVLFRYHITSFQLAWAPQASPYGKRQVGSAHMPRLSVRKSLPKRFRFGIASHGAALAGPADS